MSEWWHEPSFYTPFWTIAVFLIEEFILRENPHWCLVYAIYSIFSCIIGPFFYWESKYVIFDIVKTWSLAIPVLFTTLFRLAYVSVNTNSTTNKINGSDEDNIPLSSSNDPNIRYFEMKRVYYHCCVPKRLIVFLHKHFLPKNNDNNNKNNDSKATYYYKIFVYVMIGLNIAEAMFTEVVSGVTYDGQYNWSRFFNVISAFCLIVTAPMPFKNSISNHLCYFDTSGRYTDYIVNFGAVSSWYFQIVWVSLYTSWNWCFVTRAFGDNTFYVVCAHLFPPLIRSFFYNNNKGAICGIWLQSRATCLLMYFTVVVPIRDKIFGGTVRPRVGYAAYGLSLTIWSSINMIVGLGYLYWWFAVKQKELKLLKINSSGNSIRMNEKQSEEQAGQSDHDDDEIIKQIYYQNKKSSSIKKSIEVAGV